MMTNKNGHENVWLFVVCILVATLGSLGLAHLAGNKAGKDAAVKAVTSFVEEARAADTVLNDAIQKNTNSIKVCNEMMKTQTEILLRTAPSDVLQEVRSIRAEIQAALAEHELLDSQNP